MIHVRHTRKLVLALEEMSFERNGFLLDRDLHFMGN